MFKFYRRDQKESESTADYVAAIKKAAKNCDFGATLDEMLRDRIVCGLVNTHIQQQLLEKDDLTLKSAADLATSIELTSKQAATLQPTTQQDVKKLSTSRKGKDFPKKVMCWCCGKGGRFPQNCRY